MSTVKLRSGEVRQSGYAKHPGYEVNLVISPKRVRVEFNGRAVADSQRAALLYETRHLPVYYFPREDVDWSCFTPTETSTFCPFKGEASYWSVTVDGRSETDVLWGYPAPFEEVPELSDYVAFYWSKMGRWLEEDEEVFVHPRDPRVRLDALTSTREVAVFAQGQTVALSTGAIFLYETGLPARYYLPMEDVRSEFLRPSETVTRCPYKGTADHFDLVIEETTIKDGAWIYRDPVPEAVRIRGRICFYDERVEGIAIDGKTLDKPTTKWSPR